MAGRDGFGWMPAAYANGARHARLLLQWSGSQQAMARGLGTPIAFDILYVLYLNYCPMLQHFSINNSGKQIQCGAFFLSFNEIEAEEEKCKYKKFYWFLKYATFWSQQCNVLSRIQNSLNKY